MKRPPMEPCYSPSESERQKLITYLDLLEDVVNEARKLQRGCSCDYDYRCGNCQCIIDIAKLIAKLDA